MTAWLDYLAVLRNMVGFTWAYSLHDVAFPMIPVVAWASRAGIATLRLVLDERLQDA